MKAFLRILGLCLAFALPNVITIGAGCYFLSSQSHQLYQRIDQLIASHDEQYRNRIANIVRVEGRLNSEYGVIMSDTQRRIDMAIARHELIQHRKD
ncbi:hypothetical protein FQZ97_545920 [compost metagenome]